MPRCSVLMCKNDSRTVNVSNGGVSYHRFPKDPHTKERWMEATGRVHWFPKAGSTICSEHFHPQDIFITKKGYKYINETAVPTRNFLSYHERTPVADPHTSRSEEMEVDLPLAHVKVEATPGPSRKRPIESSDSPPSKSPKSADGSEGSCDSDIANDDLSSMLRYEQSKIRKQNLKMKRLQSKLMRLKMTIWDMEDLYTVLKDKLNISVEDISDLRSTEVKLSELVARRQTNKELSEVVSKLTYSAELRSFALTLHLASAKAYDYVRKMFKTSLPHPRTLKHWYLKVNGEPGFTKEAFIALKLKASASDRPILATLALGEMDICRRVEVDGRMYGYIDMGTGLDSDMLNEAREVLILSVTAINGNFKVPVAYFLTCNLTSEQRSELVKLAIEMAHDAGVKIVALSIDGSNANVYMAEALGCSFQKERITFKHPVTEEPIVAILDPIHLLENLQSTLSDFGTFLDKNGKQIEWKRLIQLEEMTYTKESYYTDYRRVRNAANRAFKLCSPRFRAGLHNRKQDKLEAVESEPTATFVSICISIYDLFFTGQKNILTKSNSNQVLELASMASEYITTLKVTGGGPAARNLKNSLSFFTGIKILYSSLIETNILKSLPLRSLSRDYLQLFFWNIKADAGCRTDVDLTAKKVILGYKKFVTQIKEINKSRNPSLEQISLPLSRSPIDRLNRINGFGVIHVNKRKTDSLLLDLDSLCSNNEEAIIESAVHIVQELNRKIYCDSCSLALVTKKRALNNYIVAMDKTKPLYASPDVIKICKASEMVLKSLDYKPFKLIKREAITAKIMRQFIDTKIFDNIRHHQVNAFPESNHVTDLMKAVVELYIDIYYKYRKRETYKDVLKQLKQRWTKPNAQCDIFISTRSSF